MEDEADTAIGAEPAFDDTIVVPDLTPTGVAERAWSDSHEEYPDTGTVSAIPAAPHRSIGRWVAAGAALAIAATAVAWFGIDFYRSGSPTPGAPVTVTQMAPPPPAPAAPPPPPEAPHAPAKYPWVAVAVAAAVSANGGRSVGSGFGYTRNEAVQSALISCKAGSSDCGSEASVINSCIAIAVGAKGDYSTAVGTTRNDAIATAKANAPWATGTQAFCSWDGNDTPETFIPTAAPTTSVAPPLSKGERYIRALDALGIPHINDDDKVIQSGTDICHTLAAGADRASVESDLIADNPALSSGDPRMAKATADAIIGAATSNLCPEEPAH